MLNSVESYDAKSEATNGTEDGQTKTSKGVTALVKGGEEDKEEGEEVVLVGRVDTQGQVVNESGNVVGKVEGDVPKGSIVDTEGDVLNAEGNVLRKANVKGTTKEAKGAAGEARGGVKSAAREAKDRAKGAVREAREGAEGVEKPELVAPFRVQDNREVTNVASIPVRKLVEGDP